MDEEWNKKIKVAEMKLKDGEGWEGERKVNWRKVVENRVGEKLKKDETFRSLFNDDSKENKDRDFLCRSGY